MTNDNAPTALEIAINKSKSLRPRTKELYLQHVRAFLTFAGNRASSWTAPTVAAWRDDMQSRGIQPQSVNVALNALRYAAVNSGKAFVDKVERLSVAGVDTALQKKTKEKDRTLTWNEGKQLLAACSGNTGKAIRDRAIITLGLRTGMLRFSMCQLKLDDISGKRLTFIKKGGEKHTIELDLVTKTALADWTTWLCQFVDREGFLFRSLGRPRTYPSNPSGRGGKKVTTAPVAVGDCLTPDGLYRALRERAETAGLSDLQPHVFRRTFLVWSKKVGAKPSQIAAVTGHKSDAAGDDDNDLKLPPANLLLPDWSVDKLKSS